MLVALPQTVAAFKLFVVWDAAAIFDRMRVTSQFAISKQESMLVDPIEYILSIFLPCWLPRPVVPSCYSRMSVSSCMNAQPDIKVGLVPQMYPSTRRKASVWRTILAEVVSQCGQT